MKTRYPRLLLIFASLVFVFTSANGQERYKEIDLRINGIHSGSTYLSTIKKLGRPQSRTTEKVAERDSCSNIDETVVELKYEGLGIVLHGDRNGRDLRITSFEVTSGNWIASGIKLGDTSNRVRRKFGKPESQAFFHGSEIYYYVTPGNFGGVNFTFKNKRLVKITMSETLC